MKSTKYRFSFLGKMRKSCKSSQRECNKMVWVFLLPRSYIKGLQFSLRMEHGFLRKTLTQSYGLQQTCLLATLIIWTQFCRRSSSDHQSFSSWSSSFFSLPAYTRYCTKSTFCFQRYTLRVIWTQLCTLWKLSATKLSCCKPSTLIQLCCRKQRAL